MIRIYVSFRKKMVTAWGGALVCYLLWPRLGRLDWIDRSRPPKTDFPKFDGHNPKWWKAVCEKYFALYSVEHNTRANFATMHFVGNATLWLQTYEADHDIDSWEELCVPIHIKFGKDKHHKYLEALERCKQTHSVEKYYQKFEALRHKVLVHNKHYDEACFVTKFVNGLKREIQRAIKLHKPRTVDVALSLAETQEELLEEGRQFTYTRPYTENRHKYSKTGYPGKGLLGNNPEEKSKIDRLQRPQATSRWWRGWCWHDIRIRASVVRTSCPKSICEW